MAPGATYAGMRWATRIVIIALAGVVGLAIYVVADRVCVNYLLREEMQTGTSAVILALHFFFLLLALAAYLRAFIVINTDPGLVPLTPDVAASKARKRERERRRRRRRSRSRRSGSHYDDAGGDLEAQRYTPSEPDLSPDSPGLERFYTKDVFVCAPDGRPIWCSACHNWKPDRAHHSSELGRCVRKMDHYCPWVGGMVSETSYKFFFQFCFWASCYCALVLSGTAYTLSRQLATQHRVDGFLVAIVALAAFFGLFTSAMTLTGFRFIFMNQTNVDVIRYKSRVYQLAIRVPRGSPPTSRYGVITYPLPKPAANGQSPGEEEPLSARDRLASKTFAIVKTEVGENPWDLGPYQNWVSVMGSNIFDWLLPIRQSPCCSEENHVSFYRMGPLYAALRERYGLPEVPPEEYEAQQMRQVSGTSS